MTTPNAVNTAQWNANSVVLIQSRSAHLHRDMVLKRSRLLEMVTDRNKKILDLGCGSGPFLQYFTERGYTNLYAIEPDADLIKNIPATVKADVRVCRAEEIDFESGMFDVVFVYGVLHHLQGIPAYQQASREICRVLKPGGQLFIMEPGQYQVFRTVEVLAKMLGYVSRTFKAFSECLEEERETQHFFIRNHGVVRDTLLEGGMRPIVDRYFLYSWIFTATKEPKRSNP
jgi:SAM-dependent methyltransferase